jgi:hypothetical protein
MAEKQHINRAQLCRVKNGDVASFLDALEKLEPTQITHGMWNKLYAIIAVIRNYERINYWIYDGTFFEYDVTTRTVEPHIVENGESIGTILRDKQCRTK